MKFNQDLHEMNKQMPQLWNLH